MICLTGDVHHDLKFKPGGYQLYLDGSESKVAIKYLEITEKYDLKVTLFITGKSFVENMRDIEKLLDFDNLEIGGHTWSAFRPVWLHRTFKLIIGSIYGPKFYQQIDIKKTLSIIQEKKGRKPTSWRTHSYASNNTTLKILENEGVKIISDDVDKRKIKPFFVSNNLLSLPINVMPDHEHLYFKSRGRTKSAVEKEIKRKGKQDKKAFGYFTTQSFTITEYYEIIKKQIENIEEKKGIATLLLHPHVMKLTDNFETFEKLCKWINNKEYETIWCKEVSEFLGVR